MTHKAIFVFGPESSGTRLTTDIFIKAGCYGNSDHDQILDKVFVENTGWPNKDIVFRRSIPHNHKWENITELISQMKFANYTVIPIITIRAYYPNCASKVNNNHSKKGNEQDDLIKQWKYIASYLPYINNFYILSTSALFISPYETIREIFKFTGFTDSEKKIAKIAERIYDADIKHRLNDF